MFQARWFFDAGSAGLLWMASPADWLRWGQPVDLTRLPISADLRDELIRLVTWYDTSLNWDYPLDPGPWCESECERFNGSVRQALSRLREELGPGWSIADEFKECHEDPDRERYLWQIPEASNVERPSASSIWWDASVKHQA